MTVLHIKYRPQDFDEVIGQDSIVRSLSNFFKQDYIKPHTFLFIGPSGVGKTTLARILGNKLLCEVTETDAASQSGIDSIRDIINVGMYKGIGDCANKIIIINECHSLSRNSWDALLEVTEDPPEHLYFVFCTTESDKIPKTIKTRSHCYNFKPIGIRNLIELINDVVDKEGIKIHSSYIKSIATASQGSVRKALVLLSMCSNVKTIEELHKLLEEPLEDKEVIDLIRYVVNNLNKPLSWFDLQKYLIDLKDYEAETVRIIMVRYLSVIVKGNNNIDLIKDSLYLLSIFTRNTYRKVDGLSQLYVDLYDITFNY